MTGIPDIKPPLENIDWLKKRCEVIVIYQKTDGIHILFLELKSDDFSIKEVIGKMRASHVLCDFILSIFRRKGNEIQIDMKYHYVLFTSNGHKKPFSRKDNNSFGELNIIPVKKTEKGNTNYSIISINSIIKKL